MLTKLICVKSICGYPESDPTAIGRWSFVINVGDIYDGELMQELSSWSVEHALGENLKYWRIYINTEKFTIYSYVDSGEFMEINEWRNSQLKKLEIND
jgi:hypothetical protein